YVAEFMYEGDAPLAERRAQALTLDRDLLAELLGSEDLRELLDPEAIAQVELELQGLLPARFPRDPDEAHDLLVRLGDLSEPEAVARGIAAEWLDGLERSRRAVEVRIGGEARWIAAEDAGRYREALGANLPIGLPDAFLEAGPQPLESLIRRYARTHVPFVAADLARRWAIPEPAVEPALAALVGRGDVIAGRVHSYNPRLMDELVSMGEVVWAGRGSLGMNDGRVALYLRGDAPRLVPEPSPDRPTDEMHERLRAHLAARGASFFRDLY